VTALVVALLLSTCPDAGECALPDDARDETSADRRERHTDGGSSSESTAFLTGTVTARGTREPIALATLSLPDGGVLATTTESGTFDLALPAGNVTLTVRAPGHAPLEVTETLAERERLTVRYRLDPLERGWETVVRARRDEGPARVELSRVELQEVAGTMGDPFRVMMLLPGVASIASGLSYPVVRGAQPAATGFFLDGVRVPQLYHLLAGPAVVHPDFIERVDFFAGALPARYGRLLGGAIDGRLAKPSDRLQVVASLDLLNAGAFVSTPLGSDLHVTLAGRVSYAGPIAAAVANAVFKSTSSVPVPTPVVNFGDYQGRVTWNVGEGKVRFLALGVIDEAGVRQNGPDTFTALLTSQFHRFDLAWRRPTLGGQAELGVNAGTEQLGLLGERDGTRYGQFLMSRQSVAGRMRWRGELRDGLELELGFDAERQVTAFRIDRDPSVAQGAASSFREPATWGALVGGFGEATWKSGRWSGALGLRLDGYFLDQGVQRAAFEPRGVLRFVATEGLGLRASAGLAHQAPTVLINLPVSDLAGLRDGLQEALKFDVGADAQLPFGLEASASVYWNQLTRPIEYSLEDLINDRVRLGASTSTQGRAYGLELMLRKRAEGRWFGWLSYTFQRSERLRTVYDFDERGQVTGSAQRWVPFEFDQAHVLHLTGGVVLPWAVHLSLGLHVNTGRPESGLISSRAMRPGLDPDTLEAAWVPVSLSTEPRLPAFARLDARLSRTWTFDAFTLEVFLDVFNASLSREVLGYTYSTVTTADGRTLQRTAFAIPAVLPFLGVKGRY